MNLLKKSLYSFVAVFLSISVLNATVYEDGLAIAKKIKASNLGWQSSLAHMQIILEDQDGAQRTRNIRTMYYERDNEGDLSVAVFDSPKDVKGTAFLNHSNIKDADDQWLYLPEIRRTKRIASNNKSGSFMGSEYAYEDFSSFEIEKYSYKRLSDESINGQDCYVLELVPLYDYSGYTRTIRWFEKETLRALKVDFYDRKNSLFKTLMLEDYKTYKDKYWRAHRSIMTNHVSGMKTYLLVDKYDFEVGLDRDYFEKHNLQRVR
jgi:outer membrane lipoprotein-sorting protein